MLEAVRVVNEPGEAPPPPPLIQVARLLAVIAVLCGPSVCSATSSVACRRGDNDLAGVLRERELANSRQSHKRR